MLRGGGGTDTHYQGQIDAGYNMNFLKAILSRIYLKQLSFKFFYQSDGLRPLLCVFDCGGMPPLPPLKVFLTTSLTRVTTFQHAVQFQHLNLDLSICSLVDFPGEKNFQEFLYIFLHQSSLLRQGPLQPNIGVMMLTNSDPHYIKMLAYQIYRVYPFKP